MAELGLFPLGIVLLPTERIPLHIFEPRYKELIAECIDQEREFGLVFADEDGMREIGSRAAVLEVLHRFPDGRSNVIVEGRDRFRIVELTEGRPFQTAEVEPVADSPDEAPPGLDEVERALAAFKRLATVTESEVEVPSLETPQLSFELAGRVDFGSEVKQQLLESRLERERLVRLAELFERACDAVERERAVRERAQGNGRVTRR